MDNKTEQAKRILFIYKELLKSRKLTVLGMLSELEEKFDVELSKRTVQRDFGILQ